jgi:Glycosyltransferase family 87
VIECLLLIATYPVKEIEIRPRRLARLIMLLVCSASMYFYWSRVPQNIDGMASSVAPRERPLTDLYAQWFGSRELLLHHHDPYSDEVTRELQVAYYGKDLDPSEALLLSHQQRFAYPLYVALLLAPTVNLQFHTVQVIFLWLLAMATASSVLLWARALCVKLSPINLAITLILTFTAIPVMQGLDLLQFGLLVASLLAAAAAATASGHLFLAGALLAVATIKPQMSVLAIAWFALWISGDWPRRRSLLWGFAITLSALIAASELFLQGWVMRFLSALVQYANHTRASSLLGLYLPPPLEWLVALGGFLILAIYAWEVRREPADAVSFGLHLALALSLTPLIIPTVVQPFNHVLLLPAILLVVRYWKRLQQGSRLLRITCAAIGSVALLPWFFAVVVTTELLVGARKGVVKLWFVPFNASLGLPFVVFAMLILLRKVAPSQSTS